MINSMLSTPQHTPGSRAGRVPTKGMRATLLPNLLVPCLLVPMLMAVTACGGDGEAVKPVPATEAAVSEPAPPVEGPTLSGISSRGTFTIAITPNQEPIPTDEPFDLILEVTDSATGEPFTDFDAITMDARMPAHDHGMTVDVALVPTPEPGQYTANGMLFHMIGHWEFHVDVTRGPRMERAQVSTRLEF
ncbi:MAG: hypothetical protein ACI80K_001253 [Paracoccaceae bacterium]|jgi:hypothetical protein